MKDRWQYHSIFNSFKSPDLKFVYRDLVAQVKWRYAWPEQLYGDSYDMGRVQRSALAPSDLIHINAAVESN